MTTKLIHLKHKNLQSNINNTIYDLLINKLNPIEDAVLCTRCQDDRHSKCWGGGCECVCQLSQDDAEHLYVEIIKDEQAEKLNELTSMYSDMFLLRG